MEEVLVLVFKVVGDGVVVANKGGSLQGNLDEALQGCRRRADGQ